ncbi:MAG: DUF4331 domain-containing protein [Pseudonocardiales bacterium]
MRRRRGVAWSAVAATLAATGLAFGPGTAGASSHREAPLIAAEPQIDNTDVYAFVPNNDPSDVALVANWIPFEEPAGGPNFYPFSPDAHYDINIDNNGDARADITYRWTFTSHYRSTNTILYNTGVVTSLTDPDLNFYQTYTLQRITPYGTTTQVSNAIVAPSRVGNASMPDYGSLRRQAVYRTGPDRWSFAGQADDSFFLDLRIFDLLYGGHLTNGHLTEVGHDTLKRFNVNSVVLQVPKSELALRGSATRNPVIGVWSSTERRSTVLADAGPTHAYTGPYVQLSRLGNPLVNEAIVPVGKKNKFNATDPATDGANFLQYVNNPEVPKLVQAIYGVPAPATPRKDLVEVFLTGIYKGSPGPVQADLNSQLINQDVNPAAFVPGDELRLNMQVPPSANPSRLGVIDGDLAGFPNGRRLSDDVVDIALKVLEGALVGTPATTLGVFTDQVDTNDYAFPDSFPYLALPTSGSSTEARG